MNKKKIFLLLIAVSFLGITSCAQSICAAYAKADTEEVKKEKKEGQFWSKSDTFLRPLPQFHLRT